MGGGVASGAGRGVMVTRFYTYGKQHFTQTGWAKNSAKYSEPDVLEAMDLQKKRYVVTGANSGLGRMTAEYLASKGGTIYMVCRNEERAKQARDEIVASTKNEDVYTLIGDCGLAVDVRRIAKELAQRESSIDCLMCNAGALTNERRETSEGHEVTFATHLLHGTVLLTEELKPLLRASEQPRVVVVSSGGMYNVHYDHELATGAKGSYNGQLAYAYAKRGQVMLCEEWEKEEQGEKNSIAYVSCHPGWVDTPGVEAAYGGQKKYLEPMRTLWQGSEGICWLCVAPRDQIQSGEFYLDRSPQPKHLEGWFLNSFTQNTEEQQASLLPTLRALIQPTANEKETTPEEAQGN